ncbi:RCC1 domain-containing protein [Actinoplanes philippinensis]|uniref:RCC1 domain-containing protein n=1 Tax=Actinoplanes philippinensis TaxID=35752 RepID=UPI0033CE3DC0
MAGPAAEPGATWAAVAFGDYGPFCGIRDDRSLWCWDPGSIDRRTPARISGSWAAVDRSGQHTCGIRTDGSLWCWGDNVFGELGIGSDDEARGEPARVGAGHTWATVTTASFATCATRTDGSLWCWGNLPGDDEDHRSPVRVRAGTRWAAVSIGDDHGQRASCATR